MKEQLLNGLSQVTVHTTTMVSFGTLLEYIPKEISRLGILIGIVGSIFAIKRLITQDKKNKMEIKLLSKQLKELDRKEKEERRIEKDRRNSEEEIENDST